MTVFRKHCVSAVIAVCIAGLPMIARAAESLSHVNQFSVQAGDLDLATARDRAILLHRIRSAAIRVCREENPSESGMSDPMLACQAEAMQGARESAQALVQFAEASRAVSLEASTVPR